MLITRPTCSALSQLNWDTLGELVETQEKVLKIWYEINELRQSIPCPMHSRDFWTNMVPCYFMAWDKRSYILYEKILQEVKERINNQIGSIGSGSPGEEKYRLAFVE
ncbi:MAG: 2-hydroxyacyl-CoA dehydratase family protein, partial [Nitriliruptoraceae bacterium]